MSEIMTLEEVADYLRVSERTVADWAQKGEIPGGKLGTSWRFKRSEIERWVNQRLTPRKRGNGYEGPVLSSLLSPERTVILSCSTKEDALNQMIDLFMTIPGIENRDEIAEEIFHREKLMSTGIGLSIAVPHARLDSVKNLYMALGVSDRDVTNYESLDGQPVRIIVMIIAGRDQHAQYLRTLARVSKILKESEIREQLLKAKSAQELYRIITERDKEI